eukprot:TRINITY_DN24017_c0_g1_i1.p1 TRINITY_DN24017_c0_g1~~TRINITY_DN24017_c0_g1_i1.p1  ORF type:complete len:233 (+),score=26.83 TRINITY_DN24017_c0_g1_i1:48-746(+)
MSASSLSGQQRPKRYRVCDQEVAWREHTFERDSNVPLGDTDLVNHWIKYGSRPVAQKLVPGFQRAKSPAEVYLPQVGVTNDLLPRYPMSNIFMKMQRQAMTDHPPAETLVRPSSPRGLNSSQRSMLPQSHLPPELRGRGKKLPPKLVPTVKTAQLIRLPKRRQDLILLDDDFEEEVEGPRVYPDAVQLWLNESADASDRELFEHGFMPMSLIASLLENDWTQEDIRSALLQR